MVGQLRQGREWRRRCASELQCARISMSARQRNLPARGMRRGQGAQEKNYVPDDVVFRTKPQIALDLVDRALANGVRVQAWTFDELYGRDSAFLDGLVQRGPIYVAEGSTNVRGWMS